MDAVAEVPKFPAVLQKLVPVTTGAPETAQITCEVMESALTVPVAVSMVANTIGKPKVRMTAQKYHDGLSQAD
jgi:hypothetical protein